MQPVHHFSTKECECGAHMAWTRRGFLFTRWRQECLCGRAGPWRKQPEYRKLGPPPVGGGRRIYVPSLSPFEKAERALWGEKWTAGQADKLRDLIGWGETAGPPKEDEI